MHLYVNTTIHTSEDCKKLLIHQPSYCAARQTTKKNKHTRNVLFVLVPTNNKQQSSKTTQQFTNYNLDITIMLKIYASSSLSKQRQKTRCFEKKTIAWGFLISCFNCSSATCHLRFACLQLFFNFPGVCVHCACVWCARNNNNEVGSFSHPVLKSSLYTKALWIHNERIVMGNVRNAWCVYNLIIRSLDLVCCYLNCDLNNYNVCIGRNVCVWLCEGLEVV